MARKERLVKGYDVHFVFDDFGHKGMDYEGYEVIDPETNMFVGFIPYEESGNEEEFLKMDMQRLEELVDVYHIGQNWLSRELRKSLDEQWME